MERRWTADEQALEEAQNQALAAAQARQPRQLGDPTLALGACKDELLQNLYVREVVPAPDATHLVVMVQPTSVHAGAAVPELLAHL